MGINFDLGREKIVDLLIQNGADINVMHKISGNAPLHSAVINGKFVKLLLLL